MSPIYIESFEVLKGLKLAEYKLALHHSMSAIYLVFHMSMLKKYHGDGDYIIHWDPKLLDKELSYEEKPLSILDRDVMKLRTMVTLPVKVKCRNHTIKKATWETMADMRKRYPNLLIGSCTFPYLVMPLGLIIFRV